MKETMFIASERSGVEVRVILHTVGNFVDEYFKLHNVLHNCTDYAVYYCALLPSKGFFHVVHLPMSALQLFNRNSCNQQSRSQLHVYYTKPQIMWMCIIWKVYCNSQVLE